MWWWIAAGVFLNASGQLVEAFLGRVLHVETFPSVADDQFGHPAGDRLLKGLGAAWAEQLRAVDQLARYGGEEFILLLPGASLEEANRIVDRMRAATMAGQTFSTGLATWDGDVVAGDLVVRADDALYEAKAAGRDRTVVAIAKTKTPAAVR